MIKICFLIVVLVLHTLHILPECFERKYVLQNRRAIAEKDDRLKLCDNNETLVEQLIF